MSRIGIWLLVLGVTGCSTIPESWNFNFGMNAEEPVQTSQIKEPYEAVTSFKAPFIDVGTSKSEVLDILGPSIQMDTAGSSAEQYVKNGEIYDVLYFREQAEGRVAVRAYLFRDDILIGIGLSNLN